MSKRKKEKMKKKKIRGERKTKKNQKLLQRLNDSTPSHKEANTRQRHILITKDNEREDDINGSTPSQRSQDMEMTHSDHKGQ